MKDNSILTLPACVFYPKSDHAFSMDALSLSLKRGSWTAFMGPSGFGKTTLLRGLAGLLDAEYVQWKSVFSPSFPQKNIGFFSPHDQLLPWLSVCKNIALADLLKGKSFDKRKMTMLLQIMHLMHIHPDASPQTLSSGMKQRVLLARILYTQPDILFLDEPFGHMDSELKHGIIINLKQAFPAMIVVWVTHDVDETSHAQAVFECTRCPKNHTVFTVTQKR